VALSLTTCKQPWISGIAWSSRTKSPKLDWEPASIDQDGQAGLNHLGTSELQVVADRGYFSMEMKSLACVDAGIVA